jgi:hypothetical protein
MKTLFVLVFYTFLLSFSENVPFENISRQIQEKCKCKNCISKKPTFHDLRMKLYYADKLNFIHSDFDTLFILSSYEIESGTYFEQIWMQGRTLKYAYNRGKFNFEFEKLYTDYTIELINRWDTTSLKKEAGTHQVAPEEYIYATRVINKRNKLSIDCFIFKQFFSLPRDR